MDEQSNTVIPFPKAAAVAAPRRAVPPYPVEMFSANGVTYFFLDLPGEDLLRALQAGEAFELTSPKGPDVPRDIIFKHADFVVCPDGVYCLICRFFDPPEPGSLISMEEWEKVGKGPHWSIAPLDLGSIGGTLVRMRNASFS
jgi:hypothetical protein